MRPARQGLWIRSPLWFVSTSLPSPNFPRSRTDLGRAPAAAGDLLRAEQSRPDSQVGAMIKGYIREGKIVPMEVTIKLLENAMREAISNDSKAKRFLVDGFPRQMDQAVEFDKTVRFFSLVNLFWLWRAGRRGVKMRLPADGESDEGKQACRSANSELEDGPLAQDPELTSFSTAGLPLLPRSLPRLPREHPPRAPPRARQDERKGRRQRRVDQEAFPYVESPFFDFFRFVPAGWYRDGWVGSLLKTGN